MPRTGLVPAKGASRICEGGETYAPEAGRTNKPARQGSKLAAVIVLLSREGGASIEELTQATNWLPHTTRAALTGLRKRRSAIQRSKREDGTTVYSMGTAEPGQTTSGGGAEPSLSVGRRGSSMSRQTAQSGGRMQSSQSGGSRHTGLDDAAVEGDIASLAPLDLEQLRARWMKVTGRSAPKGFRTKLLRRARAHEIQVSAYGGLSPALKRRLRLLCEAAREGRFYEVLGTSAIRPGTLLVRSLQGETHRVMATRDGFVWNGDSYGSLSTIARKITGTNWNGWTFFGVRRRPERNKNAAKPKPDRDPDVGPSLDVHFAKRPVDS